MTDALLFQYLGDAVGSCAIVPIQGDYALQIYIDGSTRRAYDFALQVVREVSRATDDVNTGNMNIQHRWAQWLREQDSLQNHPDFGARCSDYSLELLSNMPMLAELYESGTGKYQFFARLNYREESLHA